MRAALFAAHGRCRCRDQSRKPWRERPRRARSQWPRACPEGSLTRWLPVSVSASGGRHLRPVSGGDVGADRGPDCPDDLGPHFRDMEVTERDSVAPDSEPHDAAESGPYGRRVPSSNRRPRCDEVHGRLRCAGHHALDARSVLGTVQGSALRFDRARARPSGLDGACAQLADRQLRDGRPV